MTHKEALAYIDSAEKFGSVLGLEVITALMHELGDPQKGMKFVHVAGTNGKGSISSFVSSVLTKAGYKTGLYISPYIQYFEERISIDGKMISHEDLAYFTEKVKAASDKLVEQGYHHPTVFELITAIGFMYYAHQKCDVVVLEVGLGGRMDATNIIEAPLVSVITNIGYDHTEYLGTTLAQIAGEKAGIIKSGSPVVLYKQTEEVHETIKTVCEERGCTLTITEPSKAVIKSISVDGTVFDLGERSDLCVSLAGSYQVPNAAAALAAIDALIAQGYSISDDAIKAGFANTTHVGRFEVMQREPMVVVDGAHNPQGIVALTESLRAVWPGRKFKFIVGMLADKDYRSSIEEVAPLAQSFAAIAPPSARALSSVALADVIKELTGMDANAYSSPADALDAELKLLEKDDILCIFGSLYQIGEIRDYFGK